MSCLTLRLGLGLLHGQFPAPNKANNGVGLGTAAVGVSLSAAVP